MENHIRRFNQPPEELASMYAHKGTCVHCGGMVKMLRDSKTGKINPDQCFCFGCGQHYYMLIDDIENWEKTQWEQKIGPSRET
jgi:hypothetical protein